MTRLIVFAISVISLIGILSLRKFKEEAVSNKKFSYVEEEKDWKKFKTAINPVKEKKKAVAQAPVDAGVVVVLDAVAPANLK